MFSFCVWGKAVFLFVSVGWMDMDRGGLVDGVIGIGFWVQATGWDGRGKGIPMGEGGYHRDWIWVYSPIGYLVQALLCP